MAAVNDVTQLLTSIVARTEDIHENQVTGQQLINELNRINLARHNGTLNTLYNNNTEVGRQNTENAQNLIGRVNVLIQNSFFRDNGQTDAQNQADAMQLAGLALSGQIAEREVHLRNQQQAAATRATAK